ncbi:hypothetical protein NIES2119_10570 [[Phormidium ambiguum] IAM M-71]|uniref:Uncharacterized protein n=1 Tax=[Phormidium ambiguum] IAM M-71 TaxID=454136 RepID=A0A1U7IMJ5_9CYAN|nr:hypothetical protein [Phormidium ambiguum]OKH38461.1 hypothetical protein NIES2119_10570 [Phormidium ambiguum IAM M-71]
MQEIDENIDRRSQELESLGFGLYDSFHLACAEAAKSDTALCADVRVASPKENRLLKNARRYENQLKVVVNNPVIWLINTLQS